MKNLTILIAIIFTLAGCTQKNSVINLAPYKSTSSPMAANKEVQINQITDSRQNKSVVGTITDSKGAVSGYITFQNELSSWLNDAIKDEISRLGGEVVSFSNDTIVDIDISQLSANLSGYGKDNLKGEVKIRLVIKKDGKTITKNVAQSASEFAPLPLPRAFDKFIKELLNDIVKRTAVEILKS